MSKKKKSSADKLIGDHVEDVPCRITDAEKMKFGERLAQIEQELAEHSTREDELKRQLKATETRLEAERMQISGIVRSGMEPRPVRIEHWALFDSGIYQESREDTGEVLSGRVRPLSDRERQEPLLSFNDGAMLSPEAAQAAAEKLVEKKSQRRAAKAKAEDAKA